jgi:hypothetical protein
MAEKKEEVRFEHDELCQGSDSGVSGDLDDCGSFGSPAPYFEVGEEYFGVGGCC